MSDDVHDIGKRPMVDGECLMSNLLKNNRWLHTNMATVFLLSRFTEQEVIQMMQSAGRGKPAARGAES